MGYRTALEFKELADEGAISLERALEYHLTANCYPPVHPAFIPVAVMAIHYYKDGDYDTIIALPNGKALTVYQIVEGLHLDAFVDEEDE